MRSRHFAGLAIALTVGSCGSRGVPREPASNLNAPVLPRTVPAERRLTPIIDPRSSEAAVEVMRGFVELLNQGKFDEAYMLLGAGAPPRTQFNKTWKQFDRLSVDIGAPGQQEGAAGSSYLSVPLTVSSFRNGAAVHQPATAVLRRVNGVPGSTEAQRHWHIQRIDWDNPR